MNKYRMQIDKLIWNNSYFDIDFVISIIASLEDEDNGDITKPFLQLIDYYGTSKRIVSNPLTDDDVRKREQERMYAMQDDLYDYLEQLGL